MMRLIFILSLILVHLLSCTHKPTAQNRTQGQNVVGGATSHVIRFSYDKGELKQLCQDNINFTKNRLSDWTKRHEEGTTDINSLLEFEEINADFSDQIMPILFMRSVATQASLREEASECDEVVSVFQNEVFTNRGNYKRLEKNAPKDKTQSRLLQESLTGFEMNGMKLNDEDLKKYKALADRLSQLSIQFSQNLNNDTSSVSFTAEELKGAKEDFLGRLKKDDKGQYIVTTKYPDYIHVMENVSIGETRKKLMFAYNNRQAEKNTAILEEAVQVRSQIGKLMGFSTYADYSLKQKMAGNSETVWKFLKGLRTRLSEKNRSDLKTLANFKRNELKDKTPMQSWDLGYLSNQLKIKKYKVDADLVSEYFPAQRVIDETFNIYSKLFGVEFREDKKVSVWAEHVKMFEVIDQASKRVIAYFYADLFPREGKYGHAAAFPLRTGRILVKKGGEYLKPVASIVANFTPPTVEKPSLLSHDEIETFFHEFGHIIHHLLTNAPYGSLSGFNVKHDYVEAPSQMLENWIWEKQILQNMSQHYKDPKKKIPSDLVARMQKLKLFNAGIQNTRQLVFGFFDMEIHTNDKPDVTNVYARLQKEMTGFEPLAGTHFPATFGHMMGGYSAGYYGYLWSKVYAEDMFSEFAKKGILNSKIGMKYRKEILEPGNMEDPLVLIKNFLGREPNNKAFFKSLGI